MATFKKRRLVFIVFFVHRLHIPETKIVVIIVVVLHCWAEWFCRTIPLDSPKCFLRINTHPVILEPLTVVALWNNMRLQHSLPFAKVIMNKQGLQTESRIRSKEYLCYTNIHQLRRESTSKSCANIKNFRCVGSGSNDVGIPGRWILRLRNKTHDYLHYHRHTVLGSCKELGSQLAQEEQEKGKKTQKSQVRGSW